MIPLFTIIPFPSAVIPQLSLVLDLPMPATTRVLPFWPTLISLKGFKHVFPPHPQNMAICKVD